jgi:hypothetical protein
VRSAANEEAPQSLWTQYTMKIGVPW